jgi:hypothetical protein
LKTRRPFKADLPPFINTNKYPGNTLPSANPAVGRYFMASTPTTGNDNITGTSANESISALAGNDNLFAAR